MSINSWDPLWLKRMALVPFLALEWIVFLWVTRSARVRQLFVRHETRRYFVVGVVGATMLTVALAYMWLKRSIVGPGPRLYDPVLFVLFLAQHVALLVAVFRVASRRRIESPPPPRKPSPRLVFLLLIAWVIVGAAVTAISIGPWAVLPLSPRQGLTIAACAALGTLSLALALLLTVRDKRRNARLGAGHGD